MKKLLAVSALLLCSFQAQAQIGCDRTCLTEIIDTYFDGLVANSTRGVPVADDVRITLNGKVMDLEDTFWASADSVPYRWDIANMRLGDTGTEAIIENDDGTHTIVSVRLKVIARQITEIEIVKVNDGEAGGLWGPEHLLDRPLSKELTQSYLPADRDSYYRLIAAAESYWRAFQTNGTELYRQADLAPDVDRFENGLQTTGHLPDGSFRSARQGFDQGAFLNRNLWDRRYAVVDEERGIVLSMVRFGLVDGGESQSAATTNDRLVAEYFTVKNGMIQEVHAVLYNMDDEEPTGWETTDYGPGMGGWD
jgi:hypothetical protein